MNQKKENNLLWVGTIVNTHGIKGEVRILSDVVNPMSIFIKEKKIFYFIKNKLESLTINESRPHKNFTLVKFNNINDINDIKWIKGTKIYIEKEKLNDGEYYLSDLIGLDVIDQTKEIIGSVFSIDNIGPYDNLIVKLINGKKINIPIVDEFGVKLNKNKVEVNIPKEFKNENK